MLKELLIKSGFSQKEVDIYLTILELGVGVASKIAKKAHINRSTTYIVLDLLKDRGLVNIVERRGVKLFNATPADQLVRHLEAMAKQYTELAGAAKKVLPTLDMLRRRGRAAEEPRSRVQFFEGRAGIRTVYEDTLASLENIREHASRKEALKTFPASPEQFSSLPAISVYGDRIILVSPEEKFAAVVESHELAIRLKKILETSRKELNSKETFPQAESVQKNA